MAGLLDLKQFADAAARGQFTPQLAANGAGAGSSGGSPPVAAGGLGGSPRLPPQLGNLLKQILLSDVKSRFSTGTSPSGTKWRPLKHARPNGGDVPLRDTGILMASFSGGTDGTSVWVGTTHPGAALHNFGGTVRGKGKMLAIPLTKEAKRSGGPRRWKGAPLVFQPTRKPRVFLLMAPAGGTGGPRKAKSKLAAKLVAQFLLVDQVTVPKREFMGVSERAWGQITDAVGEAVVRGWLSGPVGFGASVG